MRTVYLNGNQYFVNNPDAHEHRLVIQWQGTTNGSERWDSPYKITRSAREGN